VWLCAAPLEDRVVGQVWAVVVWVLVPEGQDSMLQGSPGVRQKIALAPHVWHRSPSSACGADSLPLALDMLCAAVYCFKGKWLAGLARRASVCVSNGSGAVCFPPAWYESYAQAAHHMRDVTLRLSGAHVDLCWTGDESHPLYGVQPCVDAHHCVFGGNAPGCHMGEQVRGQGDSWGREGGPCVYEKGDVCIVVNQEAPGMPDDRSPPDPLMPC
jgi:hypothetical protein